MFEAEIYNEGQLIVGRISGVVESQSFINGMFWQIDSCNVGEVKEGFSQLYFDDKVDEVLVSDDDVRRLMEINTGIGANLPRFRTALVLQHPEILRLAQLHQQLAQEHDMEVQIFQALEAGFAWLGMDNPDPEVIHLGGG